MRHHDGYCCAGILGSSDGSRSFSDDDVNFKPHELGGQIGRPRQFFRRAILKNNVLALDITEVTKTLQEGLGGPEPPAPK
jgi:hypothetical protein